MDAYVYLPPDKVGRDFMYVVYTFGILNGKSGSRCHCVATEDSYNFLIRFQTTSMS